MFARSVTIAAILTILLVCQRSAAGIYNSSDTLEETRFSRDFAVFSNILRDLQIIPVPEPKRFPPIWRRYRLIENLGIKGAPELHTVEQKLNYSAVLIRRGKADEAVQFLLPLTREHGDRFLILAQFATANFLASSPDFRSKAPEAMKDALRAWPKRWDQVDAEEQKFLVSIGWEETAFERNRRYETYLHRLMLSRNEEAKKKAGKRAEETLDPIFIGADKKPVRFVNEQGAFEPGRIELTEWKKLPRDAIETVEQLLIWMPNDDRLLWLLGEVFNASAMEHQKEKEKNEAIRNANRVFQQLLNDGFGRQMYGRKEINVRADVLATAVGLMPPEREFVPPPGLIEPPPPSPLTDEQWWRALVVGGITGFCVGVFVIWQIQEMRRRRQARASAILGMHAHD